MAYLSFLNNLSSSGHFVKMVLHFGKNGIADLHGPGSPDRPFSSRTKPARAQVVRATVKK
jgi:hypothetical protein